MKKYVLFKLFGALVFTICILQVNSQDRKGENIIGKITIGTDGKVTVHPMTSVLSEKAVYKSQMKSVAVFPVEVSKADSEIKYADLNSTNGILKSATSRELKSAFGSQLQGEIPSQFLNSGINTGNDQVLNNSRQEMYLKSSSQNFTSSEVEVFDAGNVIMERWYGEKEFFIPPSADDMKQYEERVRADTRTMTERKQMKNCFVNVQLTPGVEELLKEIGIIIPDFITDKVKISIPECDINFLKKNSIQFEEDMLYGKSGLTWMPVKSANLMAATIWSEGFEGTFPGTAYNTYDSNTLNGSDFWDDVSCDKHGGALSIWCAGNGDMTDCGAYDSGMTSYVQTINGISVGSYSGVHFTFWTKYVTESGFDFLSVWFSSGGAYTKMVEYTGNSVGWVQKDLTLTGFTNFWWNFGFISDNAVNSYMGAFIDDISVTGTPLQPNLTIVTGSSSVTVSGTNVSINTTVTNNGTATAAASELGYYLSPDLTWSSSDYLIETRAVGALLVGMTSPESITVDVMTRIPAIPAGTYYIFYYVDHLGQVTESTEADNIWHFSTPQVTVPTCNVAISPSNNAVTSSAGSTSFTVTTTGSGCNWTASSNQSWCTLSPSSGTGNGTIVASYTANTIYSARVATITVIVPGLDPVLVTVTQAACSLSVSPTARTVASVAGLTTFTLSTNCAWTASSNQAWCTITPASGTGNASITANYTANTSCSPRIATITITVPGLSPVLGTVTQAGCTIAISPADQPVPSPAGTTSFTVSSSCAWTSTSNQTWCTISPSSGTGNGTIVANYTANTTANSRVATISISVSGCNPINVTVTQQGISCPTVTPSNQNVVTPAGSTSFSVTSSAAWTASSNQTWCTISPSSGTGNGTITADYSANTSCAARVATITVSVSGCNPASVTVTQAANTLPILTVSPASQSVPSTAGTITFSISNTGCGTMPWTVTDDADWLTVTPASGTGNLTISASYASNTGCSSRTANISITAAGATGSPQVVHVTQAGNTIPTLAVLTSSFALPSISGSMSFTIKNTGCGTLSWSVTDDMTWLSCSPASGTGDASITVSYVANTSYSLRTGTITITAPGASENPKYITVSQDGCSISVTPDDQNVLSSAGTTSFTLSSSCTWNASSNQAWCTITPSSGTGNGTITAAYTANTTGNTRVATLTITVPGRNPVNLTVTQAGCSLSLLPTDRTVFSSAGSTSFILTTTCDWIASSNQTWCTIAPISGTGNATITANFTANSGGIRSAVILVSNPGSPGTNKTVTIAQSEGCCAPPEHFNPVWTISGLDTMKINVIKATLDGINLEPGDEIALYDGTLCVGAAKLISVIDNSHVFYIKASKDNGSGNGYIAGHSIVYKFWDQSGGKEITVVTAFYYSDLPEWSTSGTYKNSSTSCVDLTGLSTGISNIILPVDELMFYPNPTDGKLYITSVKLSLMGSKVTVINALGSVILDRIIDTDQGVIDFSGNAKGLYYLKITGYSWSLTKKIVLK